ncbi:MAG: MlaD family protein [Solirubrobacteraceae bacterium]|nr:MlaD family protein [Solirubrobacteraceae bacterium]
MRNLVRTVRDNRFPVLVIVVMAAFALVVTGYLLVNQRLPLPWDDVYGVELEFESVQAVVPGQGQEVAVSGVKVGEVTGVRRDGGRAVATLRLRRGELPAVHRDARATLRPRTGLQDMTVDLDPGTARAGTLPDGGRIPASQTVRQVQLDEITATLDADSRAYLRQFLRATKESLGDDDGRVFRRLLRVGAPSVRTTRAALRTVRAQHAELERLVTRMRRLAGTLSDRDRAVGDVLRGAARTLTAIGKRDRELRTGLRELPGTLRQLRTTLDDMGGLSRELEPASRKLRPTLGRLERALPAVDPLLETLPARLRPVGPAARAAVAPLRSIDATLRHLLPVLPDADRVLGTVTLLADLLGHDPQGEDRGYTFWLAWFAHNVNSMLSTQDAHGVAWRGQLLITCGTLSGLDELRPVEQLLDALGMCR